jgi:hypothetical protein
MSGLADGDPSISYALVCLKTGSVLEVLAPQSTSSGLEDLAAATPELFRADASLQLSAVFARLGASSSGEAFQEIVLVSPARASAVQRLRHPPETALLAQCDDCSKLGLLLSGVRARVQQLEAAP